MKIRLRKTRRAVIRELRELLRSDYAELNREPYPADPDWAAQVSGRYDGLTIAYELLTGRSPQAVATEVTSWYTGTPAYRERSKSNDG